MNIHKVDRFYSKFFRKKRMQKFEKMLTFHEFQSLFQDAEIIREKFLFFSQNLT